MNYILKFILLIYLNLILSTNLILSKQTKKTEKSNKSKEKEEKVLRNLSEEIQTSKIYTTSTIFPPNNEVLDSNIIILSYYKFENDDHIYTFKYSYSDSNFYLSVGKTEKKLLDPSQKKISEIFKETKNGENSYYICFKDNTDIFELKNYRFEKYSSASGDVTGIICRKSSISQKKIIYGFLNTQETKTLDIGTQGTSQNNLSNMQTNVFVDINFIYPVVNITYDFFIALLINPTTKAFKYYIREGPRESKIHKQNLLQLENFSSAEENNKIISMTTDKRFIIVINFNKNNSNSAFVHFVREDKNELKYYFNLEKLLPDATFNEIKFIKVTEFITFKAKINSKNYIGVINLYVRKLHFIMEIEDIDYDLIYTSDHTKFPSFTEKDTSSDLILVEQKRVLLIKFPFVEIDTQSNNKDMLNCKNEFNFYAKNIYTKVDLINGNKCSACDNGGNEKIEQDYCVEKCSENAIEENSNTCKICMHDPKYYFILEDKDGKKSCVEECPINYVTKSDTFECYTCKSVNKFNYNNKCNDIKPEKGICDSENICTICSQTVNKYYYKDLKDETKSRCLIECEPNMIYFGTDECQLCSQNHFKIKNECIEKCPIYNQNTSIAAPEISGVCETCPVNNGNVKYRFKGNCVNEIPFGYFIDKYDIVLKCDEAYLDKKKTIKNSEFDYIVEKCVEKCPEGFEDRNNVCTKCALKNKVLGTNGYCADKCLEFEILNEDINTCYKCSDKNQFYYEGICINECPEYAEINNIDKICISCKTKNQFLSPEKKCVGNCPHLMIYDANKVCKFCEKNKFFNLGLCLDNCPSKSYFKIDGENKYCVSCSIDKQFVLNNECIQKCPIGYVSDNYNCIKCLDSGKFYFNEKCEEECPEFTKKNLTTNICEDCNPINLFVENNTCKDKCSDGFIYYIKKNLKNEDIKICQKCLNTQYVSISVNKCVDKCEKGEVENNNPQNKTCYNCKSENKYLFNNTCIEKSKCPSEKFSIEENENYNICTDCKAQNKYLYKNQCIEKCENKAIDEDSKVCKDCDEKHFLDLETAKCVEKCSTYKKVDNNMCIKCGFSKGYEKKPFYQEGECLEECSKFLKENVNDFICEKCDKDNKFFYWIEEKKCLENCGDKKSEEDQNGNKRCVYYNKCQKEDKFLQIKNDKEECINKIDCIAEDGFFNENFECKKCPNNNKFVENNKCVSKCSKKFVSESESETENEKLLCYECEYIYLGKCLVNKKCENLNLIRNNDTNICENCPNGQFMDKDKCVNFCTYPYIGDYNSMKCIEKKKFDKLDCLGNCDCENKANIKGEQCNIIINENMNKTFFEIKASNDSKDKDFYLFEIILKEINFEDIKEIQWRIYTYKGNEENKTFKKSFNHTNVLRIETWKLIQFKEEENDNILVEVNIKTNNLNETESVTIKPIRNQYCSEENIKFSFNEIEQKNNTEDIYIKDKYLHKLNFLLDFEGCRKDIDNKIIFKYYYLDKKRKKFEIVDYIDSKNFTTYIPDFSQIICEIKIINGQIIYKTRNNTKKGNSEEKYKNITDIDIKKINKTEIKDRINILDNFLEGNYTKEEFKKINPIINNTISEIFYDEKINNLNKKKVFDFLNNFIEKLCQLKMENKVEEFSNLNQIFDHVSVKVISKIINFTRNDYPYLFNSVNILVEKLKNYRTENETEDKNVTRRERNINNYYKFSKYLTAFMQDYSTKINNGEKISIEFPNVKMRVDRFSNKQKEIFFDMPIKENEEKKGKKIRNLDENDEENGEDNSIEEKEKCTKKHGNCNYTSSSFCAEQAAFNLFSEFLNVTQQAEKSDLAFISNIMNNELMDTDLDSNTTMQSTDAMNFFVYDVRNNNTIKTKLNLEHTMTILGKNENVEGKVCASKKEYELRELKDFQYINCKTYFEKEINDENQKHTKTICKCQTDEEVFIISNIHIFNFQSIFQAKLIQYELSKIK